MAGESGIGIGAVVSDFTDNIADCGLRHLVIVLQVAGL